MSVHHGTLAHVRVTEATVGGRWRAGALVKAVCLENQGSRVRPSLWHSGVTRKYSVLCSPNFLCLEGSVILLTSFIIVRRLSWPYLAIL